MISQSDALIFTLEATFESLIIKT